MERKIALAQHFELSVLEFNGEYYVGGTLEDFNELSGANYADIEAIDTDNKVFINWLNENCSLLEYEIDQNDKMLTYDGEEYLVVTDEEADDLWEDELDYYIDELILPELHKNYRNYFDRESWKSDARYDGRAHCLNRYDGGEDVETVNETDYYIYRQN